MTRVAFDSEVVGPRRFPERQPDWHTPEADWAEREVVGAVLKMPERYAEVGAQLSAEHFHDYVAKLAWTAIAHLAATGRTPDYSSVRAALVASGAYHGEGVGPAYEWLVDAVPKGIDLAGRVEHVLVAYRYRHLQDTFWKLCKLATLEAGSPETVLAEAEATLRGLGAGSAHALAMGEALTLDTLTAIQRTLDEGGSRGLLTGVSGFDRLTGGLEPGQLVILAGRPGTGKTSLASSMAWHVATRDYQVVLFVSLEMGLRELVTRFACLHSGLAYADAKAFLPLTTYERQQHFAALAAVEHSGLAIVEDVRTVAGVRQYARALWARVGRLDLVVVDYLQLMRSDAVKRGENRVYEIGDISIELKALARELRVPLIALAQLNRNIEQRTDRKPQLSDLRDSGQIEQDADLVAFTHRSTEAPDALVELVIRKHRNGPTGDVALRWEPVCMRFSDWGAA